MKPYILLVWVLIPTFSCTTRIEFKLNILKGILKLRGRLSLGRWEDPDAFRNVSLLISSKGYPVEEHTVQTEDGFLLGVQRIPHGKNEGNKHAHPKPVVLLVHGLLSSSADWVLNFENQSLGFILADAGYDVWLGNVRGNTYSRRHIKYTPNMKEFWEFSFDEMAEYDLPAMIDYALNAAGQKQLFYVGHSQGTTAAFALLSEEPEYNKKIKLYIALAPVTSLTHATSGLAYLASYSSDIDFLFNVLGVHEFLPSNRVMKYVSEFVCESRMRFICERIIFIGAGTDYAQMNETRLGVYMAHTPAGASTQCLIHYLQIIKAKKFQKYDYGGKGNEVHYNKTTPPQYYVENITTPVVLMWAENDKAAAPEDVAILQSKLNSLVLSYRVKYPAFNHLDFIWGMNAATEVYDEILTLFKSYSV